MRWSARDNYNRVKNNTFLNHNLTSKNIHGNGTAIVDYDTTHNQQAYFKTIQSHHFQPDGPLITLNNYHNRYVFEISSHIFSTVY